MTKKALIVPAVAAFLAGCAESDVGGPALSETGTNSSAVMTEAIDPGVAPEPAGSPPAPDTANNSAIGSSIAPSVPVPEQFPSNDPAAWEKNSYEEKTRSDAAQDEEVVPAPETPSESNSDTVDSR